MATAASSLAFSKRREPLARSKRPRESTLPELVRLFLHEGQGTSHGRGEEIEKLLICEQISGYTGLILGEPGLRRLVLRSRFPGLTP
jgi:hypothetical protein